MQNPELIERVDELFYAALELAPAERAAYLSEKCHADPALLAEVNSLLAAHEGTGSFIETPAYQLVAETLLQPAASPLIGQTLGHHRILSLLGKGGMGEVYLAEDTQLRRRVALKLLPGEFTADTERLRRFKQEARAASALNHPNIVTIHEIGQAEGLNFIITEYIDGTTLRERLNGGAPGVPETLAIVSQVAAGLAAAHESGIVHRDLKPENIMRRRDGIIKILDFGLAKLTEGNLIIEAQASTMEQSETNPGMVMGTLHYMSPEQARGQKVDSRTDIFSLGVVLYEMITGERPFEGETPSDIIAAILRAEPAPLTRAPHTVPRQLEQVVSRMLCKEREERYQSVSDLLSDLKQLSHQVELATTQASDLPPQSEGSAGFAIQPNRARQTSVLRNAVTTELVAWLNRHRHAWLLACSAVVLLVVALAFAWPRLLDWFRPQPFQKVSFTYLVQSGKPLAAAISPDGKYLAYVMDERAGRSLRLRQTTTDSDVEIAAPSQSAYTGLTYSRDGNYLYYSDANDLYRLPALGGPTVKVASGVGRHWAISPDERRIAFVRTEQALKESALMLVNVDGSGLQQLALRKHPDLFSTQPAWSPDGKRIALGRSVALKHDTWVAVAVNVSNGQETQLSSITWKWIFQFVWISDSSLLMRAAVINNDAIRIWRLTLADGKVHQITSDIDYYTSLSLAADAGRIAAIKMEPSKSLWVAPRGDIGQARQIISGKEDFGVPRWTPDNKLILPNPTYAKGWQSEEDDLQSSTRNLFIMDADGSNRRQLTTYGNINSPSVSPDGRYIIHIRVMGERKNHSVWRVDIDGRNPVQLTDGITHRHPSASPDGRWVVYLVEDADKATLCTLWRVPIDGGKSEQLTTNDTRSPAISPDGKWIACFYLEKAQAPMKLALFPFDGVTPAKTFDLPSTALTFVGKHNLCWLPDGKAVTYQNIVGKAITLWKQPIDGSPATQIVEFKTDQVQGYDWSRNGNLVYVTTSADFRVVLIRDDGDR